MKKKEIEKKIAPAAKAALTNAKNPSAKYWAAAQLACLEIDPDQLLIQLLSNCLLKSHKGGSFQSLEKLLQRDRNL